MNGIIDINVSGKQHRLRFSVHGCGMFESRMFSNPDREPIKVLTDMIYGGLYGEAMRNGNVAPSYDFAYDLIDEMSIQDDFAEQSNSIWECFSESIHGANFMKKIEELNKPSGTSKKKEAKKTP